jgi:hypothetical protein
MVAMLATGCVQRTISITSEPPGALVWLNDREVGRTPVDVEFLYYGTYDVRLAMEGYEPLMTRGDAMPPWWDNVGLDFFAEMVPGAKSDIGWHYQLQPADDDPQKLVDRAQELRARALEGVVELPAEVADDVETGDVPPAAGGDEAAGSSGG